MILAERMRQAIADLTPSPTSRSDFAPGISASAGVATFPVDARDPKELFELADQALYEAKRLGRDQVVTAAELIEPRFGWRVDFARRRQRQRPSDRGLRL